MAGSRTAAVVTLPRPLTSLIGREQELNHLYELLRSDVALVTITGFGGIGKTRLSLQAALELEPSFDAGVIFAQLAAVTQGSSIPRAIALTAGLDESIDTVESLSEALGSFSRLLVLDNLEQIPDAAEIVHSLLQAMPQVTILATSRSQLELSGEYVVPLEPLETRSDNARSLPAVQLFIERGKAANPSLATDDDSVSIIAEICQKLDGIPLAIELAAARLAIFSPTELRDQLQNILPVLASKRVDLPDRQRAMRNAIAWTYELLEQSERRLFTWLSVYEQDFSLESVRHVATQLELTDDPLDIVQFLVSRSLIRPSRRESGSPRYQMLQMLREFGHEQLVVTDENVLARRSHAMDMVNLAETAEPEAFSSRFGQWSTALKADMPNILAAMAWAMVHSEPTFTYRIVGSIWRWVERIGFSKQFMAIIPAIPESEPDQRIRARALIGLGNIRESQSDTERGRADIQQALAIATELGDLRLQISALSGLFSICQSEWQVDEATRINEEERRLAEELDDPMLLEIARFHHSTTLIMRERTSEAIPILSELADIAKARGDAASEAAYTGNLGTAYQIEGQSAEARTALERSVNSAEESGNLFSAAIGYLNLSGMALLQEDWDATLAYGEKGMDISHESGIVSTRVSLLNNIASVYIHRNDYGTAAMGLAQAINLIDSDSGATQQVQCASVYVQMCLDLGMRSEAAEMLGAVRVMRDRLQLIPYPWQAADEDEAYADLDPDNNPDIAAEMERGATLDRRGLVRRMNELTTVIVEKSPPVEYDADPIEKPQYSLTPREAEVLVLLAKGHTNPQIADELFLSTRTVTTHLSNIFGKLEVSNRSRAIAVAIKAGLV